MKIAYLDIFFGISGDMMLGALVDAGVDPERLVDELRGVGIGGWDIRFEAVREKGLGATRATVIEMETGTKAHDTIPDLRVENDVQHGRHEDNAAHRHHTDHGHAHKSDSSLHDHSVETHLQSGHCHHHGRTPGELIAIVEASSLAPRIRVRTIDVIRHLAEAEAEAHRVPLEDVHFHELGGLDTIIDIAGTLIGLELLGIERIYASPIPFAHGFVTTAHGRLAVPVPAVINILRGCPTRPLDVEGETVTPTGAAIAAVIADEMGPMPPMQLETVGYGAGQKDFPEGANLVRLFVGQANAPATAGYASDERILLEANIDDMTPELLADARERILLTGAVDCWFTPIYMKKNRPGVQLSVLTRADCAVAVADAIFRHTTTFGVRRTVVARQLLARDVVKVATYYGQINVKVGRCGDEIITISPEYEDCAALAREHSVPTRQVYEAAVVAATDLRTHGNVDPHHASSTHRRGSV